MFTKEFIKTYLIRGLIAAIVYCITVVIFLYQQKFQAIWVLYLGNGLFLLAVAALVYLYNSLRDFKSTTIGSAISGHIVALTGAALSVVLSLLLYLLFSTGLFDGEPSEVLKRAPAAMTRTNSHGMLFILIINAALGNTISGFFAAVITSFTSKRNQTSENKA